MCEHVEAWTLESACIVLYKSWHACGYASSCVLCVIFKIYHMHISLCAPPVGTTGPRPRGRGAARARGVWAWARVFVFSR